MLSCVVCLCGGVCACCRAAESAGLFGSAARGDGAAACPAATGRAGQNLPADESAGGTAEPDTAAGQLPGAGQLTLTSFQHGTQASCMESEEFQITVHKRSYKIFI